MQMQEIREIAKEKSVKADECNAESGTSEGLKTICGCSELL